jgi:hypothetical protein
MSDTNQQAETSTGPTELEVLKQRAKVMGIQHSPNIGVETLRAKIAEKLAGEPEAPEAPAEDPAEDQTEETANEPATEQLNPLAGDKAGQKPARKKSPREAMLDEQMALVRCRITNLNPSKKDLPGEIFCVGNELIGTVRKYIPYGEVTDDGYHIPTILFNELDSRRFQHIRTVKDRRTGRTEVKTSWAKEFALEVLPQLTKDELNRLANAQAAAGSVDSGGGMDA